MHVLQAMKEYMMQNYKYFFHGVGTDLGRDIMQSLP